MIKNMARCASIAAGVLGALLAVPGEARACGGFFCSAQQPVNQAAERILFADNGDGTVTAVIQILYQGPSESFSWLLPLSGVPADGDVGIGSNIAFARLQAATNPQYNLTQRVEGTCRQEGFASGSDNAGAPALGTAGGATGRGPNSQGGVTVEASGTTGAFNWTVISLDPLLDDPAGAAVTWLGENGYDVPPGAPALLGPYLEDGNVLFALRLTKGSDVGSIRPISLTYPADQPMIPIKLTAVAANDDMGVMTWLLSEGRGVPQNYAALELNEARINWFNAASNYNSVVSEAADAANGQGFVTEFAGPSSGLAEVVWSSADETNWRAFRTGTTFGSMQELFNTAFNFWGQWDGFWDAARDAVALPAGVSNAQFQQCPSCYPVAFQGTPTAFANALETQVIDPVRDMQTLLAAHRDVTRLYTTMSAAEMTHDPVFTFNPDLPAISNIHSAEQIIECSPSVTQFEAPWRIELPQGGVIRGTGAAAAAWPAPVAEQPANFRILRVSGSGSGEVLEDNSARISSMLEEYNATVPRPRNDTGCAIATLGEQRGTSIAALVLTAALGAAFARRRRPS